MKVLYIAGPYRGDGWQAVWENIMRARAAARLAWLDGWAVICPHTNSIVMDGPDVPSRTFLEGDLEILRRCDAVLLLAGSENSAGAQGEVEEADRLKIPVFCCRAPRPEEVKWPKK